VPGSQDRVRWWIFEDVPHHVSLRSNIF